MSNQNIEVSGENNRILVTGKGSLRIGNQSVEVSGENNSVVISSGSLHIGGRRVKPPEVRRGQVWQHKVMARRYQVISVRRDYARCLVCDANGKPITSDGKAMIQDIVTVNLRYAWRLIGGEQGV
jgi:hypothetical protein